MSNNSYLPENVWLEHNLCCVQQSFISFSNLNIIWKMKSGYFRPIFIISLTKVYNVLMNLIKIYKQNIARIKFTITMRILYNQNNWNLADDYVIESSVASPEALSLGWCCPNEAWFSENSQTAFIQLSSALSFPVVYAILRSSAVGQLTAGLCFTF